eukprot:1144727-Pelagomonas_calceolata.AAC.3
MGTWKVCGSTRLQNLAVRSMFIFNSTPSGNMLVGVHSRMSMKLAGKLNGMLMVPLTPEHSMKSHSFCTNEFAEVCMLPLCRFQLLSRPRVLIVLDFNQVHMLLVSNQLVRLSYTVSCAGLYGVPCLLRNTWCEQGEEGEEEVDLA